jgi:hypothetical protein
MIGPRCVRPEMLDNLAPEDPGAVQSRRDLRRVHRAMRSVSALTHAISRLRLVTPPKRILELGAGDGTLVLRLAAALKPRWTGVELTLLDRQPLVNVETVDNYRRLGWQVSTLREDVLAWAQQSTGGRYDLCIATLFLHHFQDSELRGLLRGVIKHSRAFIAIEPRRGIAAKIGSRLIGLLGTNEVTRQDAVKSVDAGFTEGEITGAWTSIATTWWTEESLAKPFSHRFIAAQPDVRVAGA